METQEAPTSSAGFQTWRYFLCNNHQPGQPTTKEATAIKNVVKSGSVNASYIVVHNPLWSSCTPAVTTNKQIMSHVCKRSIGPNRQRPPSGCTSKPWSATTNGTGRCDKKAQLWRPQRSWMQQMIQTGSPSGRAHCCRRLATTTMEDNDHSPTWGTHIGTTEATTPTLPCRARSWHT